MGEAVIRTAIFTAALAWIAYSLAQGAFPYEWSHTLDGSCNWRERPAVGFLGHPNPEDRQARAMCKGQQNPTHSVKIIVSSWPTAAERAAWR